MLSPKVPWSPLASLLLLALPGVWLLARALTHRFTRDRGLRAALPVALAIAIFVTSVALCSRAFHSFRVGLPVGTLLPALAGVLAERARRRDPEDVVASGRAPSPWMWITAVFTALALAPAAFNFWFHDEVLVSGHLSTVAQIQSGAYPPVRIQFPDVPFRYHFGFDLLSACLTVFFRLRVDAGIDLATVLLWAAAWLLLWALGERLIGRRFAWLTPVMALYASGMPVGCPHSGTSLLPNMISECPVGKWSVNGPVISYFFQHPWALGIPLFTAALLVFTERSPRSPLLRLGLLAFLLGALSYGEVVLFVTVLPSMIVAEAHYEDRLEIRRALSLAAAGVVAVGFAFALGGFLGGGGGVEPTRFIAHAGFADTFKDTVRWNAMTFGVMWVTGLLGLVALRRGRLFFILLVCGSLVVVNGVRFTASADIMKFATVVQISLGVLGSVAVARILPLGRAAGAPFRTAMAVALLAATTWVGVLYPIVFLLDLGDLPGQYRFKPDKLTPPDLQVIAFLRPRVRLGDMVYRAGGGGYAQWAGLPQPGLDWTRRQWGVAPARLAAREQLLKAKPADLAAWKKDRFRYFVLDEGNNADKGLIDASTSWIAKGQAAVAARFGALRVIEIR